LKYGLDITREKEVEFMDTGNGLGTRHPRKDSMYGPVCPRDIRLNTVQGSQRFQGGQTCVLSFSHYGIRKGNKTDREGRFQQFQFGCSCR
jgi:hypothetical protein